MQISTRTTNEKEAKMLLAHRMSEVDRGVFAKPVRLPLAEFNKRYMDHAKTHKRSWVRDEHMLRQIERIMGPVTLSQINPLRVEMYQQKRLREKVSPATVNRELAVLKHGMNLAERWGLRQGPNPVRAVKFLREDNLQFVTLSETEEAALLKHCPSYLQDTVLFALNSGLRCGDLFDLKWEEVDLEGRRMARLMQKSRRMLKSPLNDVACDISESWAAQRKCPYVFYNQQPGDFFRSENVPQERGEGRRPQWYYVARIPAHIRFAAHLERRRYRHGEGVVWPFDNRNNDAICSYKRGNEAPRGGKGGDA